MIFDRDSLSAHLYTTIRPSRRTQIKRVYKLAFEDLVSLIFSQGGKCAICDVYLNFSGRKWHIDHIPTTNKVRGVLCHFCNTNLMPVFDRFSHLIPIIKKYIERHRTV